MRCGSSGPSRCGEAQQGEEWRVQSTLGDIGMGDGKGKEGLLSGAPVVPARGQEREAAPQSQSQHAEGAEGPETLEDEVRTVKPWYCS